MSVKRPSVRLWQTELFVIVIVVAILVLSVLVSRGLQSTLTQLGENDQLSDASALASQLSAEFPLTVESRQRLKDQVKRFHEIYGDDVWVYRIDGSIIDAVHRGTTPNAVLEEARLQGLADSPPYASMELRRDGRVVAGKAVYDEAGRRAGVIVISGPSQSAYAVLEAVRSRLWTTFWIALIVSGLLGLGFSEFIGRRVRQMIKAATAIADGDFDQRLPTGLVPDEIFELAKSYNRMAVTLGETFSTLSEREQEIAAVVHSMGEGVVAFDSSGVVRVLNGEAARILGVADDPDTHVGTEVSTLSQNEDFERIVRLVLDGVACAEIVELGSRSVLVHATPTSKRERDETLGAVMLMSDVTEQKRLEDAQRRFIADASHELRTPITGLKGLLELLIGGAQENPEVREDFLRTMSLEVDRLGRLVADLLTLAQLEAGGLKLRLEPVRVTDLFSDLSTVLLPVAESAQVGIALDVPDREAWVLCDRDRITQVLLGFVDNAIKHVGPGGTITLHATPHGDRMTLAVQDNGVGIGEEHLARLFDRFYRADQSRATPRGTGLGLSIAKEIVEAHDSVINVVSRPGEGARFEFDLPVTEVSATEGETSDG